MAKRRIRWYGEPYAPTADTINRKRALVRTTRRSRKS